MLLLVLLCSCKHADLNYVQSNLWQWDSGYKIGDGDFVEFDTSNYYRLSHDTIFRQGIPKCIVMWTDAKGYEMKVKSFTGQTGLYINTVEFTK
ncbi:hypothetical protein GCM10027043_17010 [Ferruginibacter profundus]